MKTADQERVSAIDEVAGLARLTGALVGALVGPIQQTHQGVSKRVFDSIGPVAKPVRAMHDGIAALAYGGTKLGAQVAGQTIAIGLGLTRGRDERRSVSSTRLGQQGLAFGSGLFGDWMVGKCDDLIVQTYFTYHGEPLTLNDVPVTNRLVVFVHGLAETTSAWSWWSKNAQGEKTTTYAKRLESVGWTPIELGWNTGQSVNDAGREISRSITELIASWPVPVTEVALVGHSMGGMAISAACDCALGRGDKWVNDVTTVVYLGAPFGGSWLAKLAHHGASISDLLPETTGLATFLNLRSAGIRDLTDGWGAIQSLTESMPETRFGFFSASLRSPLNWMIGDGLVSRSSATPAMLPADEESGWEPTSTEHHDDYTGRFIAQHYTRVGHVRLVNHPDVAEDLVSFFAKSEVNN